MTAPATRLDASLAALRKACEALPPHQPRPVACPIFGNTPPPAAPGTAGLPPMLAAASAELARALREPPSLGDKFPFAGPAWLDKAPSKVGRPSGVQPNQVVRLVRYVDLGQSVKASAARVGLARTVAQRILSGQHKAAHTAAVEAAGVVLPPMQAPKGCPKYAQKAAKAPPSPERPSAGATVATAPLTPLKTADFADHSETDESGVPA